MARRFFGLIVILTIAMGLCGSGCLIAHTSEDTREGKYVADSSLEQIEPGKTTSTWVKATLGEPTTKTKDGDVELWKYSYTQVKKSESAVFLIFGGSDKKEESGHVFIEFKDGVVLRKWRG